MGCGTSEQNIKNVELITSDTYQRRELIGVGHHGRVYRSFYQIDKKEYANKVIDQFKVNVSVKSMHNGYVELVSNLKKFRHEKIARYFHFQFNDKEISIIMELANEGTLKKYIQKNGPTSESLTASFTENILQALDFLHCAGFMHKDLKTSNVLLMPKNQIKLSDYVIAEIYDNRISTKDNKKSKVSSEIDYFRGQSLPYMAPQVIKNIQITEKSDVWSVGCIVLQLLTGKVPWFDLGTTFKQAFKILSSGVISPIPEHFSTQCKNFLEGCLAIIPTQRLSVKQLLRHKFIRPNSKNDQLSFQESQQKYLNKEISQKNINPQKIQFRHEKSISNYEKGLSSNRYHTHSNEKDKYLDSSIPGKNKTKDIQQSFKSMKQSLGLIESKIQARRLEHINKSDIKPIVEEQPYTVIINNKKVKLQPNKFKNIKLEQSASKNITSEQQWASPEFNKDRQKTISKHSFQSNENNNFQNHSSYRNRNRSNSQYQDSLDTELKVKNLRVETQPHSSGNFDKEYFKKPLKLLKKKLKENKEMSDFSRKLSNQLTNNKASAKNNNTSMNNESHIYEQPEAFDDFQTSKIRVRTEMRREEIVINTELARAERDRYINEQKNMKKVREEQKNKWEEQLKKGAEILKKELNRFYYPQGKINFKN